MNQLWKAGHYSVRVSDSVRDAIQAACDDAHPNEVGGLLFGTYPDSCTVHVERVLNCAPGGLCDFERTPPDPVAVKALWDEGLFFVGDWHSHPDSDPTPSGQDHATLIETANDPAARCPAPIMLIVGNGESMTGCMDGEIFWFHSAVEVK